MDNPRLQPVPAGRWCRRCFYDLRGLTSDDCPECGKPFIRGDDTTFSLVPGPVTRLDRLAQALGLTQLPLPESTANSNVLLSAALRDLSQWVGQVHERQDQLIHLLHAKGVLTEQEVHQLGLTYIELRRRNDQPVADDEVSAWLEEPERDPTPSDQ